MLRFAIEASTTVIFAMVFLIKKPDLFIAV